MRFARFLAALLAISILASQLGYAGPPARAQTTEQAEDEADAARNKADAASGLVDDAVENRAEIEAELTASIARMNELAEELSRVGADVDRIATQVGYADVELAGIQSDIEDQAVDAYMTVVASPSVTVVNSSTVEKALVASSVVEDVVADGRLTVGQLSAQRNDLEALKDKFLADQEQYAALKEEFDAEVARYAALFEEADAEVAQAIRDAEQAEADYSAALTAVEIARDVEAERERQEARSGGDSTTPTSPPDTTSPTSGGSTPTTTSPPAPPTTSGGGGPWNHSPAVEQWRGLVSAYFPSNRVEEALAVLGCESNGDPNAHNPYSGAAGLFQFLPSTWASTSPQAGFAGASVYDAEANIGSAAWLGSYYESQGQYFWAPWSCRWVLS